MTFRPPVAALFVPATRLDRLGKAATSGGDAIIVDLEDAVPPEDKARARDALAGALGTVGIPVYVRVNASVTPWHETDLDAARALPIAGIMLPKVEDAEAVERVASRIGGMLPVIGLIESATGIAALPRLTTAGNLAQIAFGSVDFALDIGAQHDRAALSYARAAIVLHSRAGGLPAPLDGVTLAIGDAAALFDDCTHAAALGFGGKLGIHPSQMPMILSAFLPSKADLDWARRVMAAMEAARGAAVQLDGMMIDAPVHERARRTLLKAGEPLPQSGVRPG